MVPGRGLRHGRKVEEARFLAIGDQRVVRVISRAKQAGVKLSDYSSKEDPVKKLDEDF